MSLCVWKDEVLLHESATLGGLPHCPFVPSRIVQSALCPPLAAAINLPGRPTASARSPGPVPMAGSLVGQVPNNVPVGASVTRLNAKELNSASTFASIQLDTVGFHLS